VSIKLAANRKQGELLLSIKLEASRKQGEPLDSVCANKKKLQRNNNVKTIRYSFPKYV
jgi:hypothetical protein